MYAQKTVSSSNARFHRALVASALALVACSGTYVLSQDAGVRADASSDASPEVVSAPPDAGSDAPIVTVPDASPDAPPASICTGKFLFCDDFDDASVPPALRWSSITTAAGSFDYDDTTFVSPGHSLRLQLNPNADSQKSSLSKDIDVPSGDFRVSFDVRVDFPPSGSFSEIDPMEILLQPLPAGVREQGLYLTLYPEGPRFEAFRSFSDGGKSNTNGPVGGALGVFNRVVLTVRGSSASFTASLAVGGGAPLTHTLPWERPTKMALKLGAPYTSAAKIAGTLRFDNVLVEEL